MGSRARNFGQYEIVRRLGVGGMAETFEARRRIGGAEQRVCLKRVLPAFSEDPKFKEQFLSEARIAATLRHSNIVSVLDFGAIEGTEFMVLELVDGLDLRALLASMDEHRLDAELVALVGLDLAYALSYAHNAQEGGLQGVVHRDISPANVLISVRGEVKLADFGIAKAMTNAQATASGLLKGKIPYMAPEQMRAQEVDGRADLFSLGVSLYEALAGQRPFQGSHDVEVMTRLLAGERLPLSEVAPEAPAALRDAIEGLLHIRPSERTATAESFVDALSNCAPTPVARRRLAELVQERGGLRAPNPGRELTELGPLDTELGAEPVHVGTRAPAASSSKALVKSTRPATPAVVQAAEVARAAAAAMTAGHVQTQPGVGVSKATIPSSPNAIAVAPATQPVPKRTMPSSPKAFASASAPTLPVSQGTMPTSPVAAPATPGAPSSEGSRHVQPVVFPAEPHSEELVLPVDRPRFAFVVAAVGVLLLIGSAVAFGLHANSSNADPSGAPLASTVGAAGPTLSPSALPATTLAGTPAATVQAPAEPSLPSTPDEHAVHAPPTKQNEHARAGGESGGTRQATTSVPDSTHAEGAATGAAEGHDPDATHATEAAGSAATSPEESAGSSQYASESGVAARVTVRTDPWGSVWVDGRYIGRSPAIVVLPVGPHELGGGVGHIMGTRRVRVAARAGQDFVVHVDYPAH